ncbi:uncharacterized protein N7479_008012 [Penicillium vulpinum]|uniref:N-acetylglucosamine-induced protein 1 n=1 Tax=Penicillium vulpinum TaxID=29845 RepID=A0A1V6RLI2_9EURO|nr:uncharacterized protein N7479_008012 [Penicillium vulpinum]KAJ5960862.1 hypothetical protein N7479_008012 [Penicillium vulpinum]OQE02702.1 hypothetical protein PENVUL_c039G00078 [Penicillium vulpinum]
MPGVPETPAFNLTELDHKLLAMTDEEFVYHDWEELKGIIGKCSYVSKDIPEAIPLMPHTVIARNDLGVLKRKPSDLRRYLAWTQETKTKYGTIMNYICQQRLQWPLPVNTTTAAFKNPIPFADSEDYKILRNDWPYGLTPGISHLVVWLRTPIPVQSDEGHLTDESRAMINSFVRKTFVDRLAKDPHNFSDPDSHVLWFKNWVGLQSVRALEHVHILVRDVPEDILFEWASE